MRKWCRFVCTTIADPILESYRIMPSHRLWWLWSPTSDLVIPTLKWCECICWRTVPEGIRARSVFVFRHRRVHSTQPVLRCHQETRVSTPGGRQELHETILQGMLTRCSLMHSQLIYRQCCFNISNILDSTAATAVVTVVAVDIGTRTLCSY